MLLKRLKKVLIVNDLALGFISIIPVSSESLNNDLAITITNTIKRRLITMIEGRSKIGKPINRRDNISHNKNMTPPSMYALFGLISGFQYEKETIDVNKEVTEEIIIPL
jgi:hypothetical protein